MNTENKEVKFSAKDNGFTAFMEKARAEFAKTRKEAQSIYTMFADEAKKQNLGFKDTKRFIDDQLKALREQLKVQKELTQEKLKQNREAQAEAARAGNTTAGRALLAEEAKLEANLANISRKGSVAREVGAQPGSQGVGGRESVFSGVLKAELFRDIVGLIRQAPNAKSGVDLVSPAFQAAGAGIGGAIGGLVGPLFGPALGYLGKEIGGFLGDAITRSRYARNEYDQSLFGYRAIGGRGAPNDARFARLGISSAESLGLMAQTVRATGTAGLNAQNSAALVLGLDRGYGVDQSTTMAALGASRFGGGAGTGNTLTALATAVAKGIDRSRYADVVQGQTKLMERWSSVATRVNDRRANEVLFGFHRLGGEFEIGDRRAMGNIETIQGALSNPNSAFAQAQSYAVLRRLKPGAGAFDLVTAREQGLNTPGYLEGILHDIDRQTSGTDFKKFQLKGLTGLSNSAIDTLWSGFKQFGTLTDKTMGQVGLAGVEAQAAGYTTSLQKQQAEIQNAFKDSFKDGITAVATYFKEEMLRALLELGVDLRSKTLNELQKTPGYFPESDAFTKKPAKGGSIPWNPVMP